MVSLLRYFDFSQWSYYRLFIIVLSHFHLRRFVVLTFHYRTIAFSPIVLSCFHHRTIKFSPSDYRGFTIVLSCFHRRTIVFSTSYYRVFTIGLSRFHNRKITFSLSYYQIFAIVESPSSLTCALRLYNEWIDKQNVVIVEFHFFKTCRFSCFFFTR